MTCYAPLTREQIEKWRSAIDDAAVLALKNGIGLDVARVAMSILQARRLLATLDLGVATPSLPTEKEDKAG